MSLLITNLYQEYLNSYYLNVKIVWKKKKKKGKKKSG